MGKHDIAEAVNEYFINICLSIAKQITPQYAVMQCQTQIAILCFYVK